MLPAQPNQSIVDGMALIQTLAISPQALGTRELARLMGLEPTRVNRLLKTFEAIGYVKAGNDRKYRPGAAMHVLSAQSLYASGLLRRAMPVLRDLEETQYAVALGVVWGGHSSYLYYSKRGLSGLDAVASEAAFVAYRSAIAAVILAEKEEASAVNQVKAVESCTSGDLEQFKSWMSDTRESGYVRVVRSKRPLDVTLAVPVGGPYALKLDGEVQAGLALTGAITQKETNRLKKRLMEGALEMVTENLDP